MRLLRGIWLKYFFCCILMLLISCQEKQNAKKFKIGFSQCTGKDAWRRQMLLAMQGELAFHPELELEYKDAEDNNERQIQHIEEFIKNKVDLLIVSPNEAAPITPVVEKAFQSGIPVIIIDRRTNSSLYSAYIGANNYEIGKLAGDYVAEMLNGKGSILEIWGRRGSSPAIDRHRGFAEEISKYPDIKIVAEIDGKWEQDTARAQLKKQFTSLPPFDVVFGHNDVMAFGAYTVCKEFNVADRVKFIGIDALPGTRAGIQFVDDEILTASFLYPTGGEEAIRIASQILYQRPYEKENILLSTVVDSKNVRVMKLQSDKILAQQKDIVRQQEKIEEQIQIYYSQRVLIYFLLATLVAAIVAGAVAAFSWREKNEILKRLQVKSDEILAQRNTIAEMAEKAEIATQEKLKFFTNISHEFKTPLTLIMGPVEELISKGSDLKSNAKENLLLIRKNAIRLLRLVNQLMDFRKIEDKKMMVRASEHNLIDFVSDVMTAFDKVAQKRKIDFRLNTELKHLFVWFDADMLDKVIFNLLSNAFKFTADKGRIHVGISVENNRALITVEDNGLGMTPEHSKHAFDRFYTGENFSGTGIGLSLSKEFIDLHKGELILKSERGEGTRFYVFLLLGKEHFEEEQLLTTGEQWIRNTNFDSLSEEKETTQIFDPILNVGEPQKDYTILIIEDNSELRSFIRGSLEKAYNIEEAQDGVTGLKLAYEVVPDIIICDVMLPGKDGLELAKVLKSDLRTSHIPIIILTAKGSFEQKIAGVQTGADEYITKPFVLEYLHERIKALIKNRELLRQHYSHDLNIDAQSTSPTTLDKKFINDFTAFIEKNIANCDLNVNDIGKELGMSRGQIYRKVKALLGYSVNDYIISVRLKRAKHLLLNTDKTISDISYEVGFSSHAYFSTAFKNKYNLSPKEFKSAQ